MEKVNREFFWREDCGFFDIFFLAKNVFTKVYLCSSMHSNLNFDL